MSNPDKPKPGIFRAILGGIIEQFFGAVGSGLVAAAEPVEKYKDAPATKLNIDKNNGLLAIHTQGISGDWLTATGDFDTMSRGNLNKDQLLAAMHHLAPLDTPDTSDSCPAHILTEGSSTPLSFIGQGGFIFCPETGQTLNPEQATNLAFGIKVGATTTATPSVKSPPISSPVLQEPQERKRKFGWQGALFLIVGLLCFIATAIMAAGVNSMRNRDVSADDISLALSIGAGFAIGGLILVFIAFRFRK